LTRCDAVVGIERSVYYRERAAAMYSSVPYSAAQAFVEVISAACIDDMCNLCGQSHAHCDTRRFGTCIGTSPAFPTFYRCPMSWRSRCSSPASATTSSVSTSPQLFVAAPYPTFFSYSLGKLMAHKISHARSRADFAHGAQHFFFFLLVSA
jgi:hypothetical protein